MLSETTRYNIILLIAILITTLLWRYPKIAQLPPRGFHTWRQTFTLSYTLNYYNDNLYPFTPRLHSMGHGGDLGGKYIVEFPLVQYVNAIIWKIIGKNEITPRLLTLFFSVLGFIYLRMTLAMVFGNFSALLMTLFLWITPIHAYYCINYLIDPIVFGTANVGLYHLLRSVWYDENRWGKVALWFSISALIKIMGLYSLLSVISAYTVLNVLKRKPISSYRYLFWTAIPVGLAILWYYVIGLWYSEGHRIGADLFCRLDEWRSQFENFILMQSKQIFPMPFTFFMLILALLVPMIAMLTQPFRRERSAYYLSATSLAILYHLAWFHLDHEYYYLLDYQFIALSWLSAFRHSEMGNLSPQWQKLTSIFAIIILIISAISVRINLGMRYGVGDYDKTQVFSTPHEVGNFWWVNDDFEKRFAPYLKLRSENILLKIGIKKDDLIICMPEYTPCTGLYYLDRRGWTDNTIDMSKPDNIQKLIEKGAKYAVISNYELLEKDYPIWRFAKDTLYSVDKTLIVSLKNPNP